MEIPETEDIILSPSSIDEFNNDRNTPTNTFIFTYMHLTMYMYDHINMHKTICYRNIYQNFMDTEDKSKQITSQCRHMIVIASQITGEFTVCSTVCVQAYIKELWKLRAADPLWEESTGDRWIPLTKGQKRGTCFHLMTSSCYNMRPVLFCFLCCRYIFVDSLDAYTHILQDCFTHWLAGVTQCLWSNPVNMGEIDVNLSTSEQNKTRTLLILLDEWCISMA